MWNSYILYRFFRPKVKYFMPLFVFILMIMDYSSWKNKITHSSSKVPQPGKFHFKSSVKFPQSVMIWGAMSYSGVGPLGFIKSKVNTAVYHDVSEHFLLLTSFMEMLDSFFSAGLHFSAGLGTCPHCQKYQYLLMTIGLLCLIGQQTRLIWTP